MPNDSVPRCTNCGTLLLRGKGDLCVTCEMDDDDKPTMAELIERSSLGTPAAKKLRARTPPEVVDRILQRVREATAEEVPGHE